ncbi:hypothetical protein ACFRKE_31975 [Kitasatospora indigofera]|uniref:hypothetical protein n=1 Tax=Kitasatospora indigofera TaxID=67307 RepID=UPI0036B87184
MNEPQHTAHTGSGRTPALHVLVAASRADGSQVWLADPGEHHHDLADHVDRHALGVDATHAMLQAATGLIRERQDAAFAAGLHQAEPAVRILLTDLPAALQRPGVAELIEQILRTGRKAGVLETAIEEAGTDAFRGHPHLRPWFTAARAAGC